MDQHLRGGNSYPDMGLKRYPSKSRTPLSCLLHAKAGQDSQALSHGGFNDLPAKNIGAGRRILIIEDDASSRELYGLLLQAFGYATDFAANGEEGLARVRSTSPDLILCDILLPGLDGVEVMKRLKADSSLCRIPIIALTIFSSTGHRERLLAAGFDGYMSKPTIPEEFIREIIELLPPNEGA